MSIEIIVTDSVKSSFAVDDLVVRQVNWTQSWRDAATASIEKNRKGDLQIR